MKNIVALAFLLALIPSVAFAQVIFPNRGGTGTTTIPTTGQVLIGFPNGTYGPVATSALGISGGGGLNAPGGGNGQLQYNASGTLAGTSSPVVGFITATRTDATSTLPRLSVTTAFNFLGTIITDVAAWFAGLFDANLATKTTDDLTEGSNLYYTDARSRGAISETVTGLEYNSTTGVLSTTSGYVIPTAASTTQWTTAFTWGNHATAGYLTSYTETDPVFLASAAAGITGTNITNWNTAYVWGNHASSGYLTTVATSTVRGMFSASSPITYNSVTGAFTFSTAGDWTGTFDGQEGTYYLSRANHTGTQLASTISDLTAVIQSLTVGTTSAGSTGNLAFWTGTRTLGNVATGTLTETATGLSLSGSPVVIGGSSVLTIDSGFTLASTTGLTNLYSFYDTPSSRITAGTGIDWTSNTLNVTLGDFSTTNLSEGTNLYYTDTRARSAISETITGIDYTSGTGIFSLTSGYVIPTSTLWTQVADFYQTPSTRITAGANCSWTGNTFNCEGGGGGGSGGGWSTTTDAGNAITFTSTDAYVGGSASNTAEIILSQRNGLIKIASSTDANATATIASVNTVATVAIGAGSTTADGGLDMRRGLFWSFSSSTRALVGGFGGVVDLTFDTNVYLARGLKDVTGSLGTLGMVLTSTGTSTRWVATSSLGFAAGGSNTVYLATSSGYTTGQVAFATGAGTVGSTPTTTLTETVAGLELSGTPIVLGATPLQLALTSGFSIPSTTLVTSASSFFANPSSLCTAITGSAALCDGDDATGAGGSFTVGPTSTPMRRSTLQGWTFPDGSLVNSDIQANRFHTIKPIWYEVTATGSVARRNVVAGQPYGYNASNTEIIKENSSEQFVTISANDPEIHVLTASSTLVNASIAEFVGFATSTGFTGIELDWEGFGEWTAGETEDFLDYVRALTAASHAVGLKTMVYAPPIWNSVANGESGSGDEWDSANSSAYYELTYEDLEATGVDYIVIAVYDYQFDYSAGRPNAPLKWQDEIISFAKRKIVDHDRIIIGLPAAGYFGATGGYSITGLTYSSSTAITGFSGATRDTESWELTWTNGGNSYFVCDDECIDVKRSRVEEAGINRVSLWHIGGNRYGTGYIEPTIQEPPIPSVLSFLSRAVQWIGGLFKYTGTHDFRDATAVYLPPSYRNYVEYFNDFMDETTNAGDGGTWSEDISGTAAACTNTALNVGNRPGMSRCTTGSTATGRAGLMTALNSTALGQGTTTFESAVQITTLSDATNRYQLLVGFHDTNGVNNTDGAWLLYDEGGVTTGSAASANWQCVTANNGTETFTTSATVVTASTYHELKVVVNPAGTEARFYVDDALVCTHTTNIPTTTARATSHGVQAIKSVGTTARTFDIDYNFARIEFTTPR